VELAGDRPGLRATLLLYDGSPFVGRGNILFDYADAEAMTHFGTSAKFIDAIAKIDLKPRQTHKLKQLRAMFSTGSPLVAEGFDYVYARTSSRTSSLRRCRAAPTSFPASSSAIRTARCIAAKSSAPAWAWRSMCSTTWPAGARRKGRTGLHPLLPGDADRLLERRRRCEVPRGLLRALRQYLVPRRLCRDHRHGGFIIYGRSDATLNPGGVRIGTAEIYRQVEKLAEVVESIVIGQDWPPGNAAAMCAWCCSSSCAKAWCMTTRWKSASSR
jgi:acetoacetyl-CoA synthetase